MVYNLGPKAQHIYDALRYNIQKGELAAGSKLLSHIDMAAEYGVAPLTVRQVYAKLEEDGWVIRQQGRGTFVRKQSTPAVLILDDEPQILSMLSLHIEQAGYEPLTFDNPVDSLECLEKSSSIALILSDVRLPDKEMGINFIRTVRRRWPQIPLAVLTGYPDDLDELHGTAEWPILILAKPIFSRQLEEALRLALRPVA